MEFFMFSVTVYCHVLNLLQAKALGRLLFDQVCRQLNLLESDYFGLEYTDPTSGQRVRKFKSSLKHFSLNFNEKSKPPYNVVKVIEKSWLCYIKRTFE
jgi:DNA/RNA endonuclease G (NUC1)